MISLVLEEDLEEGSVFSADGMGRELMYDNAVGAIFLQGNFCPLYIYHFHMRSKSLSINSPVSISLII